MPKKRRERSRKSKDGEKLEGFVIKQWQHFTNKKKKSYCVERSQTF